MLSPNEILLIFVIIGTLALILSNRLTPDVVAVLVMLTLGITGLVTSTETLAGFSSPVVVTLIGLFVITHALEDTGIIQWIARRLNYIGGGSEVRLVLLFMAAGAAMSLVMNNVAAGAVLLPAAVRVGQVSKVRLSKLLMPLSFGTLVGGMATYLTTANIILSGLLHKQGLDGLGMVDFIPTGGLIVSAGLIYMLLIGRHILPERDSMAQNMMQVDLQQTYQLDERLWEVRVLPGSRLAHLTLGRSCIGEQLGLSVLAIWRGRHAIFSPEPDLAILPDDYLLVLGRRERVDQLLAWGVVLSREQPPNNHKHDYSVDFAEVIIAPRSVALGQTLSDLKYRAKFGLTAVALWREGRSYRTDVGKMPLQVGDALLVIGSPERVRTLANDRNYLVPGVGYSMRPPRPQKAVWALLITIVTLALAILDALPLPQVMLGGAIALVITRCLSMEDAYRAIEWRVIFLVAGILPLSTAMIDTGLAAQIGVAVVNLLAGSSALVLVAGMFLLSTLVTQVIGGQVAGLIVGPIAITTALSVGISPQAMAVAVAIGCSTAFLTPIAHPVNILMMGPGGYQFSDFFKVGLGMTLVTLVTLMLGMVIFWGVGQ
jgi:di/tricarboxylate transporter